jgi:hypothetical protein
LHTSFQKSEKTDRKSKNPLRKTLQAHLSTNSSTSATGFENVEILLTSSSSQKLNYCREFVIILSYLNSSTIREKKYLNLKIQRIKEMGK